MGHAAIPGMNKRLVHILPLVLPLAVRWARKQEGRALAEGEPLDDAGLEIAKMMGVRHPEKIRVLAVDEIRGPGGQVLGRLAERLSLFGRHICGITYRYGILVRKDCLGDRLLIAHECVHTGQYERLGGFKPFLRAYLRECIDPGYPDRPLEREAIEHSRMIVSD